MPALAPTLTSDRKSPCSRSSSEQTGREYLGILVGILDISISSFYLTFLEFWKILAALGFTRTGNLA